MKEPLPPRTSGLAVAGLVCGGLGLCTCGVAALAGLVLSIAALRQVARGHGHMTGKGLAIAALAVSVAMLILGMALGGAAAVYLFHLPVIQEIWENAKSPDDDSEFIAEPKETLRLPRPSLTAPFLFPRALLSCATGS